MISIKNVNKSFGTHHVLTDISLEVPKSNVIALIGPSGAGKSTLI
ncbi:MAG: ATP-binding cassette domain-containing protein, partial [Kurthia sp.]|nr:ATP-binding cassette domain-containing protein [Kurthia sp.]